MKKTFIWEGPKQSSIQELLGSRSNYLRIQNLKIAGLKMMKNYGTDGQTYRINEFN
jgi:hypothetical protein